MSEHEIEQIERQHRQEVEELNKQGKIMVDKFIAESVKVVDLKAELEHCQGLLSKACHREIDEMERGVKAEAQNKLLVEELKTAKKVMAEAVYIIDAAREALGKTEGK